jgi:hypothetical protein
MIDNIKDIFIDANIYYNEGLYKKSLDNLFKIYNKNIINSNVLRLITQIYLLFDNYNDALKYTNINIKHFKNYEDFDLKFNIIIKLNNKKLLEEFLLELPTEEKFNNIKKKVNITLAMYNNDISELLTDSTIDNKNELITIFLNNNYYNNLKHYAELVNDTPYNILSDTKKEYRYFCFNYSNLIKNISLPNIPKESVYEAVLIEFREMPHLEFLIRNAIHKLKNKWAHTIICGNLNYNYIFNICKQLSANINIIKLDYDNLSVNEYNKLLASTSFWNLLNGEKILIYQEDTCIFGNNIDEFIKWDYIGAPWIKEHNNNLLHVGNGGFSLRTKQCMLDVINKQSIESASYNKQFDNIPPEDVYFSKMMIDYNIGQVADYSTAFKFSSECYINPESFGGHCFYLYDKQWKDLMYKQLIIKYLLN